MVKITQKVNKSNQKGITLIALIITIIVLLILAGVAISTLTGENGLLVKLNESKRVNSEAEEREFVELAILASKIDSNGGKLKLESLQKELGERATVTVEGDGFRVKIKETGREYVLDKDGNIISINNPEEDLQAKYEFEYYSTFSKAIADANDDTKENADATKEDAVAGICNDEDGKTIVLLLKDTSESETINITRDLEINLGGKTLTLTTSNAYLNFAEGTTASINATKSGSTINKKEDISTVTTYKMIKGLGTSLEMNGGEYLVNGTFNNLVVFSFEAGNATLNNCNMTANVENSGVFYNIQISSKNEGETKINNCKIDATTTTGKINGIYKSNKTNTIINNIEIKVLSEHEEHTYGIENSGVGQMTVKDSTIICENPTGRVLGIVVQEGSNINLNNAKIIANTSSTQYAYGVFVVKNGIANIIDSNITASSERGIAIGVSGGVGSKVEIANSNINITSDNSSAIGVENSAGSELEITNTNVFADATNADANTISSHGINNYGTLTFNSGTVTGTHSGLSNIGKVYIKGGTFRSCCHGGIYFAHGPNGEAIVENATIECVEYAGKYPLTTGLKDMYGGFYLGGGPGESSSNISVYMNNCTIKGGKKAFVFRGTDGEKGNKVYISNSTIEEGKTIRIDNDTMELHIGAGCNFDASNTDRASAVSIDTTKVYNEAYVKNSN